ncbi:MAG: phosphatase PAP2 family protein [Micromonosporaceae bacterium]
MSPDLRADYRVPPEPKLWPAGVWWDAVLLGLLVAMTVGLAWVGSPLLDLDVATRSFADSHRPYAADLAAQVFNHLGQGLPLTLLCLGLAILHVRRLKTYEPLLPVATAFAINYVSIGVVKLFTDRGAPHYGSVLLFSEASGVSYPSGHAANGVVWYGVLSMLLAPFVWPWVRRLVRYGPVIVVSFTTTYLGHHWLTDTVAGILIGLLVDRLIRRNLWRKLRLPSYLTPAGSRAAAPTRTSDQAGASSLT